MNHIICPECGAETAAEANCQQCGCSLAETGESPTSESSPPASIAPPKHPQFGMASMMLTVTLMAVLLAVLRIAPGFGLPLIIVVTPAFIRATVLAARAKTAGQRLGPREKLKAFLASLGLVLAILLAIGCTYLLSCGVGLVAYSADLVSDNAAIFGSNAVGILGQLAFTILFICWLWVHRVDQKNRLGDIGFIFSWGGFVMINGVLICQLAIPTYGFRELAGWGFVALPGLVFSLIALRLPHRSLTSCGVGFGLAACAATFFFLTLGLGGMPRQRKPDDVFWMVVVLLVNQLAAIAISAALYYLIRWWNTPVSE